MATTVVKTIGTGGDYTTLQAWEDACPASLVAVDQIWQGKVKNQEFTSAATLLTVSGTTVDATRYVELTTDTGASFIDNASASTNPLRYDATKGAALVVTGSYAVTIQVSQQYTRINKLQISGSATGTGASATVNISTANGINCDVNQCILEGYSASATLGIFGSDDNNTIRNSAVIQKRNSAAAIIAKISNGTRAYNCTFVSLQAALTVGIQSASVTSIMENCYVGNVVAPSSGTITKTNCYSSATATGYTVAVFSTATFENITLGTHDFRLKAGSALIDVGATDATHAANDIIGTVRTSGSYDVGAWEVFAAVNPALVITWTEGAEAIATSVTVTITGVSIATAWTEGAEVIAIAANSASTNGTITTPVLKNNTGTILANETGVIVNIYNASTGALVVRKTGQVSSAGGIVTVSDALIVVATAYAYEVILTTNGRRLPLATAS